MLTEQQNIISVFKRWCCNQTSGEQQTLSKICGKQDPPTLTAHLPLELWIEIAKLLPVKDNITLQQVNRQISLCAQSAYNYHLDTIKASMANADVYYVYRRLRTYIAEDNAYGLLALASHHYTKGVVTNNLYIIYDTLRSRAHRDIWPLLIALYGRVHDLEGMTMLYYTVMYGHLNIMEVLVCHYGIPVDIVDNFINTVITQDNMQNIEQYNGCTPLYYAAKHDKYIAARCLLDLGANAYIKSADSRGYTPLHIAAEVGSLHTVRLLLEYKVDPNITDNCKRTPLHIAAEHSHHYLVRMLLTYNANINILCEQLYTPLHLAVNFGCYSTVKLLMESKAISGTRSITQQTPLHDAIIARDLISIYYLLRYNANINIPNRHGSTALHVAMSKPFHHIWHLMAMQDLADFTVQNNCGKTLLDYARQTIQQCQDKKKKKMLILNLEAALFRQQI